MIRMTSLKIATILLAGLFSTAALAQFVWIDEHGVKQFSDTPPPASIPAKNILKQPHRAVAAIPKDDAATTPDDTAKTEDSKPPMTTAEKNADYNKRKAEQAAKDKKAAEDAKRKQANEENCTRAKEYLATLKNGGRIQTTDQEGQKSYMDDDERAKQMERAQQAINDCDKG